MLLYLYLVIGALLELAALLGAAFLNEAAGTKWMRYRRYELAGLLLLWFGVTLGGLYGAATLLGGFGGR